MTYSFSTVNASCAKKLKETWPGQNIAFKVMKEVGEDLVVRIPQCQSEDPSIFKPPHWYEQYQFSGYNLESHHPPGFWWDSCRTRNKDPENTVQHLQQYQSYNIILLEHISPAIFGAGWVMSERQTLTDITEQLENTFCQPKGNHHWSMES